MLVTASLELTVEKQNAHAQDKYGSGAINAVQFSPDGSTIVSCGNDQTIKVWDAGVSALTPLNPQPESDCSCACGSIFGAQDGEAERAQRLRELRGLLARWRDHRVRLAGRDDQSLGVLQGNS